MKGLASLSMALTLAVGCTSAPQDVRSMITPEAIAASNEPLLYFEVTETGQQAIMSLTGQNGDVMTWSTADGRSISLQDGVLVASRGFIFDLMSADVSGTLAALNGGPKDYQRFTTHLTGENQTVIMSFACQMSRPTPEVLSSFGRNISGMRWIETCSGTISDFTSTFFVSQDTTWYSTQALSSYTEQVIIERINY